MLKEHEGITSKLLGYLKSHERHISAIACVVGFIFDASLLPSIEHVFTRLVSVGYFTIAVLFLLLSQAVLSGKVHNRCIVRVAPIFPLVVQFVFGGLLSVVFVYYFRSSALLVSWPLILLLGILFVGNEIWKKRLERLEFQIAVFFTLFLFFSIFAVPLLVDAIGTGIFLLSVALSIVVLGIVILLLSAVAWQELKQNALRIFLIPTTSALLVVGLYFTDILPPIPLVTRADGVYHSLLKNNEGGYVASAEIVSWRELYFPLFFPPVYHRTNNEPVYFYSAVYAPTKLRTPIIHLWQYWNTQSGEWQTSSRISFPINGGREAGYRGYSQKESVDAGLWRVLVQTEDGRTLSRKTFTVASVLAPPDTTTILL